MISNQVTRTVFELLGDKTPTGYSLTVNGDEIPLFLNKDGTTEYPQIRVSPFIEKGDNDYQKYIEEKYRVYRHWQYGIFQVDIYSKNLIQAQNIYDVITRRLFDFFNLETFVYNWNNDFEQIDDYTYRNKSFALMDDDLFKDIYGIRIQDTILKKVQTRRDLVMDSYCALDDYLYLKTKANLKKNRNKSFNAGTII